MSEPAIAVCHGLEELRGALAVYCQRRISRRELDRKACLGDGHASKLLAPTGLRKFCGSLRWVLLALELEIVLRPRAETAHCEQANGQAAIRLPAPNDWRRNPRSSAKRAAAFRALSLTPEQRSAIARKAANARWQRREIAE